MPIVDGVEATRRIVTVDPEVRIVVLTSFGDDRHIADALHAGAVGYVLKHAGPDELLDAIRAAARGDAPLDPKAARVLLESRRMGPAGRPLSAREEEVLRLVAGGIGQQADRPQALDQRAHREGAPHQRVRPARGDRPHAGRALGAGAPPSRCLVAADGMLAVGP